MLASVSRAVLAPTLRRCLHSSCPAQALSKFAMPAMSPTMTEGGIATWKKKEGETFSAGDVLLEIETDKATMDVEAQDDGILAKIIVGDGSKAVQVGTTIAVMGEEGDSPSAEEIEKIASEADKGAKKSEKPDPKPEEKEQPKIQKQESAPSKKEEKPPQKTEEDSKPRQHVFASPVAKRLAAEKGYALSQIKGTGPNGRIIKEDVENFKPSAASSTSGAKAPSTPPSGEMTVPDYTDVPVSNMRRVIGSRLTESKQQIPHYYLTAEIQMDRIEKLRQLFNSAAASATEKAAKEGVKAGTKLSVNDFILKACSIALQQVPEANTAWMGDFIRQYKKADIAVAVATPTGLITPIVTDVGSRGLASISSATKALAAKARDNKLQPSEYQGGSFTVSNLGMYGISHFTAIINPPQSCILAVGATEQKLVLDESSEKGFKSVSVMKVTLSSDHRTVDGAVGARWLQAFKDAMENPLTFML